MGGRGLPWFWTLKRRKGLLGMGTLEVMGQQWGVVGQLGGVMGQQGAMQRQGRYKVWSGEVWRWGEGRLMEAKAKARSRGSSNLRAVSHGSHLSSSPPQLGGRSAWCITMMLPGVMTKVMILLRMTAVRRQAGISEV